MAFAPLFDQSCTGCHGAEGHFGPAPPLNDALFLAIISQGELTSVVRDGRSGTLMPAFDRERGGSLTTEQVEQVTTGIRSRWQGPVPTSAPLPEYSLAAARKAGTWPGQPAAGRTTFATVCARCHGPEGRGGIVAGALHNTSFLALVSDQVLRRIVITGRPDLGMPNFQELGERSALGQPLSSREISNIVSYVITWRTATGLPPPTSQPRTPTTTTGDTAAP
jgi:cytochrome c oxidase cbb3-type subunit 3